MLPGDVFVPDGELYSGSWKLSMVIFGPLTRVRRVPSFTPRVPTSSLYSLYFYPWESPETDATALHLLPPTQEALGQISQVS